MAGTEHSVAREWNETMLDAIRNDFARPTVHARNLFHTSVVMWDAWACYDEFADGFLLNERHTADDIEAARREAISYAAYRILRHRFAQSANPDITLPALDAKMAELGYDIAVTTTDGTSPAAIGNRCAAAMVAYGLGDHSNEVFGYVNEFYEPVNPVLLPPFPGNPTILDPNRWQPLTLEFFIDQSGQVIPGGSPEFLSPEWGAVAPFSLDVADSNVYERDGFDYRVYHDPGAPPYINGKGDEAYRWGNEMVVVWGAHLDPADNVMIDISPSSVGGAIIPEGNTLADYQAFYDFFDGGDNGQGTKINPITNEPYEPNMVPRGDYGRVLAEFWADGPDSETPPGHWFTLLNYVSDHPLFEKRMQGDGPILDDLEWDVKSYLAMGGAMHDAAITAWGCKGWYDYIRPVSAIRYLADQGQSSDPNGPSYDPNGIRLIPGYIEVVTEESIAMGERHEHLAGKNNENLGKIAFYTWRGPDYIDEPMSDVAGVGWILGENWWPYQRPSFVTPPFAGYVSGHSVYSRTAALVMESLTGSPFFPGGLGEFVCEQNEFLVFEDGPSQDITLQWATYMDASDQTSLSRIWGGIHPPADDLPGRRMGNEIAPEAWHLARLYFAGHAVCAGDLDTDESVGMLDLIRLLNLMGECGDPDCRADLDLDGSVDIMDLTTLIDSWGSCGG